MKSLIASIALAAMTCSAVAAESGVQEQVRTLAELLGDGVAEFKPETAQLKPATLVDDGVVKMAWVVLFQVSQSQKGKATAQYLAVFEDNAKGDFPEGAGYKACSLINFMKVGDAHGRTFETFSAFGEYVILKAVAAGNQKTADVVIRFNRNSITEVTAP